MAMPEVEVPQGNIKKLSQKAVKRIDADVDGDVDTSDPKSSEMGEFVPDPTGKKKIKTKVQKESLSDWRGDLREVMTDTKDLKKVKEKKVKNKITINPKLGEAVEKIGGHLLEVKKVDGKIDIKKSDMGDVVKDFYKSDAPQFKGKTKEKRREMAIAAKLSTEQAGQDQNQEDPKVKSAEKKENQIKKRVLMQKLRAVRNNVQGIIAHNELDGEMVEGIMTMIGRKKKEKKAEKAMDAGARAKRKLARKIHAKYVSGSEDNVPDDIREGEALDERLGGKGYKSYTSLTGKKVSGDWEDSDRGAGNKAKKRAGGKVEKKSPTYQAHVLNKEEVIDERTLSSYIPSDRQGEASAANREYVKGQLKKKEDESTKNRGDLSKRDAGKMAKERLRTKKIMSMGEASAVLDANKKISDNEKREKMKKELIRLVKHAKDKRADINRESVEHVDESKGHKGDDSFIEGETGSKTSRRNLTRAMSSTTVGMGKGAKGKAEDSAKRRERHKADRGVKTKGTKAGHSGSAYPKMSKTLDDTYPHKKTARLQRKLVDRKAGRKHVDDTHHSLKQKTVGEKLPKAKVNEAKVDQGRSDYGKASIRNYRRKGPGHGEPAMFDPENKRGKLIDKRREEHKARRGVKGAKVPAYKVSESKDTAFDFVVNKYRKKYGKDAVITKDSPKPKPPSDAEKAKAAAERKKRQDADNKAYAARAKKAGFKSTQDYTNVVARYGSEDNYNKGKGLGT